MSDSEETRRSDALNLLQSIFSGVSDTSIDTTLIDPADAAYSEAKTTSWDELSAEGLVLRIIEQQYLLTATGWAEALARADVPSNPEFLRRVGVLSQTLKARVKGRQTSIILSLDDIVKTSGLPAGWIFNVIDSHLISRLHGRKDASWFQNARGRLIEIPRDFGLEAIDLFADLRAENQKLKEQAEHLQQLVGDFSCPTCQAPLVEIGHWEHQYGNEEVKVFACGKTEGAPNGDISCTTHPDFPAFEDFKLATKSDGHGWICYASHTPKNRHAGCVNLPMTMGNTEEEAKAAMRDAYRRRAAHWH